MVKLRQVKLSQEVKLKNFPQEKEILNKSRQSLDRRPRTNWWPGHRILKRKYF